MLPPIPPELMPPPIDEEPPKLPDELEREGELNEELELERDEEDELLEALFLDTELSEALEREEDEEEEMPDLPDELLRDEELLPRPTEVAPSEIFLRSVLLGRL